MFIHVTTMTPSVLPLSDDEALILERDCWLQCPSNWGLLQLLSPHTSFLESPVWMQDCDALVLEGPKNRFLQRTYFLVKQSLQTKHITGNAPGQQATVTSVFSWTELSADIREIVAGL
jgi:hypothetical protein